MTWSIVRSPLCFTAASSSQRANTHTCPLTMFDLLPVSWRLLESSDDEGGSSWHHFNGRLSVLDHQLHCHLQTLPILCCLGNIFTNFLWGLRTGRVRPCQTMLLSLTKPRGPIFGAREEVAPTSPPTALRYTAGNSSTPVHTQDNHTPQPTFHCYQPSPMYSWVGSNLGGILYTTLFET